MKEYSLNLIEKITYKLSKSKNKIINNKFYQLLFYKFNNKENFFHLACKTQSIEILNTAILNHQDINSFNKDGLLPIHIFLEAILKFDDEKNMYYFHSDNQFYELFFKQKPQIDKFWRKSSREIKSSFKSIFGYPVEVLIMNYQEKIYNESNESAERSYGIYLKFFKDLYKFDNKNIIEKKKYLAEFYPDDNTPYFRFPTLSFYHVSYNSGKRNWMVALPILSSEFTKLDTIDDSGHTLLHLVFGKLHNNILVMNKLDIDSVMLAVLNNPNFTLESLNVINDLGTSPLSLLRGDSLYLTEYFKKLYLHREIGKHIDIDSNKNIQLIQSTEEVQEEEFSFNIENESFKI